MANRSINDLAGVWEQMRDIVAKYDVKILPPPVSRRTPIMPQNSDLLQIVDYPSLLSSSNIVVTRSKEAPQNFTFKRLKDRKPSHNHDVVVFKYVNNF